MKVIIYWVTKDGGLIDRLRQRFGISAGISVNGETETEVDSRQMDELREYEKQGFIQLRYKNK